MKRALIILCVAVCFLSAKRLTAQTYQANWESLDSRPTPSWWSDAKFGIFIHWGVYSVPSYSKVGEYSEWYQFWLKQGRKGFSGKEKYADFHNRVYGPDFAYQDFVPQFKAELFDPDQWANIFERSGAKYIVLTSKHHDGFTLWNSAEANRSWGRPWNSVDVGPQRDLLGDLTAAVRKTAVKMGIYFSVYEWYNPLYVIDPELYVDQHYIPQLKDVITQHKPSIIWVDGEWEHDHKFWKSEEVLAWVFNESPVRDDVVVNDRWGSQCRHHHGGHYTTEYGSGMDTGHPWEECRGMGHSFGYSRTETIDHYNTAQQLILILVDIVSRGGNFLLDIGPTGDGRIPVIMQQRLLEMGDWLAVNGEAIYGTTSWRIPAQWSEGEVVKAERGHHMTRYDILELTVNPPEGHAVKEVFFTRKADTLYAIVPVWPDKQLVLKGVTVGDQAEITMLGVGEPMSWKAQGDDLVIDVPMISPNIIPCRHAYTFRITHVKQ